MSKKIFFWFGLLFLLLGGLYFFTVKIFAPKMPIGYCPFCDENVLERQKFYEDELVIALCTHRPIFPSHFLVIPKRHVERFELLTDAEISDIGKVIKKVNGAAENAFETASYLLLQKNGREVGQSVPHLHFHYIGRKAGDDSITRFFVNAFLAQTKPPLSMRETQEKVEKMKKAMEQEEKDAGEPMQGPGKENQTLLPGASSS